MSKRTLSKDTFNKEIFPTEMFNHELKSLASFSGRIGRNPLLVQASSGNTSIKLDGTLWIKASGKWLAYADQEDMLLPLSLPECLECFRRDKPFPVIGPLQPSIETFMHAVLPHRIVVHVHSVNTIAWAVRADAPLCLAEKLQGLNWQWIPYVASGAPLARAVEGLLANIFVLGNHGLVICADSIAAAESLLLQVEQRLNITPRPLIPRAHTLLPYLQRSPGWHLPEDDYLHALGTDPVARRVARDGILYPCQAMFLGHKPALLTPSKPSPGLAASQAPYLIAGDSGVLLNANITTAEYETLCGFVRVVQRIPISAPLRYLQFNELEALLGEAAQAYKRSPDNLVCHQLSSSNDSDSAGSSNLSSAVS